MTLERAIEILDPTRKVQYRDLLDGMEQIDEACRMGMEALKKRRPKRPVFKTGEMLAYAERVNGEGEAKMHKWADWVCPECGWFVGEQYLPRRRNQQKSAFCAKCGQAIDWTEAKQSETYRQQNET